MNWAAMTTSESITVTLPRSAVGDVLASSNSLLDHMHDLLEKNTEGSLDPLEREELERLVEMAQFGQILSTAIKGQVAP